MRKHVLLHASILPQNQCTDLNRNARSTVRAGEACTARYHGNSPMNVRGTEIAGTMRKYIPPRPRNFPCISA